MKFPDFSEEKKLWRNGSNFVAGLDEAGRGPLAGPVVAAAFIMRQNNVNYFKKIEINDSKKLSKQQREYFYGLLTSRNDIAFGVGIVSEKIIDNINILEATKLAMQKAIKDLKLAPDFLLLDGNFKLNVTINQRSIIKGDQKVFSIAAASIIAKVTRDRIMETMHQKYPQYGFNAHRGYGTPLHIQQLKKFGPCAIHRKSFYPVSSLVN